MDSDSEGELVIDEEASNNDHVRMIESNSALKRKSPVHESPVNDEPAKKLKR